VRTEGPWLLQGGAGIGTHRQGGGPWRRRTLRQGRISTFAAALIIG
jgi:hypothetical protein